MPKRIALLEMWDKRFLGAGEVWEVAPEMYLQASVELFLINVPLCWIITLIAHPDYILDNEIVALVGYPNPCVGFDLEPARWVAVPITVMYAYCSVRYAMLDSTRAEMSEDTGRQSKLSEYFTKFANLFFAGYSLVVPMLYIFPPDHNFFAHLSIFIFVIITLELVLFANFVESSTATRLEWAWMAASAVVAALLILALVVDFRAFSPIHNKHHSSLNSTRPMSDQYYEWGYERPVPAPVTAILDWGWFMLMIFGVLGGAIPRDRTIKVSYALGEYKSMQVASSVGPEE